MAIGEGIDPRLSGRPGDEDPAPQREAFNMAGLNQYLDSAAGLALLALHGSRQGAINALLEQDKADLAWRRARAEYLAENYYGRYPSVADAVRDTHAPIGGGGAQLNGTADDIVAMYRHVNPRSGAKVIGEDRDNTVNVYAGRNEDGSYIPADTRPPWRRDG